MKPKRQSIRLNLACVNMLSQQKPILCWYFYWCQCDIYSIFKRSLKVVIKSLECLQKFQRNKRRENNAFKYSFSSKSFGTISDFDYEKAVALAPRRLVDAENSSKVSEKRIISSGKFLQKIPNNVLLKFDSNFVYLLTRFICMIIDQHD